MAFDPEIFGTMFLSLLSYCFINFMDKFYICFVSFALFLHYCHFMCLPNWAEMKYDPFYQRLRRKEESSILKDLFK